jgi:nucleoside phosphorylase
VHQKINYRSRPRLCAPRALSQLVRCNPQHLTGLLGTADNPTRGETGGFVYIVESLKSKGLVEQERHPDPSSPATAGYRLTFDGWARFEELRQTSHGSLAQPKPAPDPTPTLSPRVAVVLTAIQAETEAVLGHLVDRRRERVEDTWFQTGRFDHWTVAIAEVGPGNAGAGTIAVRALTHFKPEIAAFVGVAGGLKDVTLGDVVGATKVYGYESGKETPDGFRPRPDVQRSDHELEQRARVLRTDTSWLKRLNATLWSDRQPAVYVDPIAAGEVVVAATAGRIAIQLKQHYGDALAVEMEGRGFLEAAHIHSQCRAVVVRGISDLLSDKAATDKLGWQRRAADAAAAFFFEMLALNAGPAQPDYSPPSTQSDQSPERPEHLVRMDTTNSIAPDWRIHDLFYHLRPDISADGPSSAWDEVGKEVLDKLSTGQLNGWGREIVRGATTTYLALATIDRTYWRVARFTYVFLLDNHERDKHATQNTPSRLPDYGDLQVNRAQALKLWPSSLGSNYTLLHGSAPGEVSPP